MVSLMISFSFRKQILASFLILLLGLLLTACQTESPITAAKSFLKALDQKNYNQAVDLLVINRDNSLQPLTPEEKQAWVERTQIQLGEVSQFNIQDFIPLSESQLQTLNVAEGYEIFFFIKSKRAGKQNFKTYILKTNGSWKLIPPQL